MTSPDSLFETASYELNKFIERRMAERRAIQRDSQDRRRAPVEGEAPHDATSPELKKPPLAH